MLFHPWVLAESQVASMKYSPDLYFDLTEQRKVSEFYPVDHNPPRCKLLHEVCSCARARPVRQSRAWGLCSCIQASQHSSTLSNGFSNGWMCGNTSLCEAEIHGAMVLLWFRWLFFGHNKKISSEEVGPGINRTLTTGTLSRDVHAHGPKIDFGYFFCVPCTPGGCALFWE